MAASGTDPGSLIGSITAAILGASSLLALAGSLGSLSRRSRLQNRITAGRTTLVALSDTSPARGAIERAMTRDAAILAARALVPVSPWRIALPVLLMLVGYLTGAVGYTLQNGTNSIGKATFVAGIGAVVLGEVLLVGGTTRRQALRQRKVLAIEQGRPSGSYPLDVDVVGKDVIAPRTTGARALRPRQRVLALWRAIGG